MKCCFLIFIISNETIGNSKDMFSTESESCEVIEDLTNEDITTENITYPENIHNAAITNNQGILNKYKTKSRSQQAKQATKKIKKNKTN